MGRMSDLALEIEERLTTGATPNEIAEALEAVSYTHLTLPTKRIV